MFAILYCMCQKSVRRYPTGLETTGCQEYPSRRGKWRDDYMKGMRIRSAIRHVVGTVSDVAVEKSNWSSAINNMAQCASISALSFGNHLIRIFG